MKALGSMLVFVDDFEVSLMPGMTVRHALMAAGLWPERELIRIRDEWGNELGFNGAVHDGMKITTEICP